MKLEKEKLIGKYNIAFGFFIASIIAILIYNFISLDIFNLRHISNNVTKLYFADNISPAHQKVIDLFNERNQGEIEVVPINLPFTKFTTNERKELLARSLRTDNSIIDVFSVDLIWISRFAKWAEPLDNYFAKEELERILPSLMANSYFNNTLVSIPMYLDIGVLFYRRDLMAEKVKNWDQIENNFKHSLTWEQLIDISRTYFPGQYTFSFQGKAYEGLICNYAEIVGSMGGQISFDDSTKINAKASIDAIEFMHDLIHKHKIAPLEVTDFSEVSSYRYMRYNDVPFLRGWFSSSVDTVSFDSDQQHFSTLDMAMLPAFGDKPFKTSQGGWNLMIKKNCTKKDEAVKFIKFILSNEIQELMFNEARFLFVTNEMYDKKEVLGELTQYNLKEIIENHSVTRPVSENYTKISDIYSFYLNQALRGKIGAEVATDNIIRTIFSDQVFIK
ncbi:MAG: extracellular solute-binding protein [Candidatus Marinimicrobia bacterium]|nr:extracellular solute-binding protein [Candidatus Neomarinimicrobiota bacterium]